MANPYREIYRGKKIDLQVLGRAHVKLPEYTPDVKHVLISITDPLSASGRKFENSGEAELYPSDNRLDVLRLNFFDMDEKIGDNKIATDEDAAEIVNFINKWVMDIELIVVHCEMGISRSAGVAAALSKWINEDDMHFYKIFSPNRLIYRLIMNEIYGNPYEDCE